ncbi:gp009 [Rhodococcus phage ReqiDocB7]|uniref:gp009 n=1 Tax=Rhodococcus phage ReqiDocB7 TaxID=691966 RepID=UPI0001CDD74B|nr:gp009 [Rhodococcus phage ReqiDocB7]ADD80795.1 gp009 [Rhodococcus phage ReqiDocB7]
MTTHTLRCTCARKTILGVYGINEQGQLFFHQIIRKQGDIKGQVYTTSDIHVWCHSCHMWWKLDINKHQRPRAKEMPVPGPLRTDHRQPE